MAKGKGKKFNRKGKKIGQANAKIEKVKVPKISPNKIIIPAPAPTPVTYPAEATASDPERNSNEGASRGKEKETEKTESLSGFIFMCNKSTKLECYQYRVFGLPLGKKEVVEEIKPGAKLFLFDFELKLLYGVYEATSAGKLNLEPAAFGGKFPAQVKFKIFKECLPLPERSLRHVIKENYTGSKFKQELETKQVRKLLSSFHPLAASSLRLAPQALANVSLSGAMPPPAMEYQFKHTGKLPVMEVPYLADVQYSHTRPLAESQLITKVNLNYLQAGYRRMAAYMEQVHPNQDHRSLPAATGSYHVANSQQPSFSEGVAHGVQEPSYSMYRTTAERAPHAHVTSLERYMAREQRAPDDEVTFTEGQYHQLPLQREALNRDNVAAYNSNLTAVAQYSSTAPYSSSVMQTQVHSPYHPLPLRGGTQYQDSGVAYSSNPAAQAQYTASVSWQQVPATLLPSQREALYQDNAVAYNSNSTATAQYTSSVMQTQVPAPYHQLPLQGGAQYQDSVVAYSSNPAAQAQYTASVSQSQVPATLLPSQREALHQENVAAFNSNIPVSAQNTSSVTQVLAYAPISSYYTYCAAGRLSH